MAPTEIKPGKVEVDVHLPPGGPLSGMAADVRVGLTKPFKELAPRYFYDERGSELFERITETSRVLPHARRARDPRGACRRDRQRRRASGDADRARLGIREQDPGAPRRDARCGLPPRVRAGHISEEITRDTAARIADEYGIAVHGLVCDFERDLERIPLSGPRLIAFLGGTIGNFEPQQRASFLARVANLLEPDDRFLLGTDLIKDAATIEAAYNDAAGVTAAFNKNVLAVLNQRLGADFDLDAFEHVAFFDEENLFVDIRLRSLRPSS